MPRLTEKQQRFVEEYLIDLNAKASAIRAGYSPRSAHQIGHELLGKPHVAAAIAAAKAARSERTRIEADRVLMEYARLAFANITDVMSWTSKKVQLKPSKEITEHDAAAIKEVSQTITDAGGTMRIRMHDKLGALDALARHLKIDAAVHRHGISLEDSEVDEIEADLDKQVAEMFERYSHNGVSDHD